MRMLLIDFVLGEKAFREETIETIDPPCWVRQALSVGKSYLEPLQGGQSTATEEKIMFAVIY